MHVRSAALAFCVRESPGLVAYEPGGVASEFWQAGVPASRDHGKGECHAFSGSTNSFEAAIFSFRSLVNRRAT